MLWTEATSCWTDGPDIIVLVQGDGHTEVGEERHLPHLCRGESWARAVGLGIRAGTRTGPKISLIYNQIWKILTKSKQVILFSLELLGDHVH